MLTTFHVFCIIARYMYVILSESLIAHFQRNTNNGTKTSSHEKDKYYVPAESYFEDGYGPRFVPPLFVQRYLTVQNVLADKSWGGNIRKLVEFGCADLGFFQYLKKVEGVQEILEVDIDPKILLDYYSRVAPLNSDYIAPRSEPLSVFVFEGNIAKSDGHLLGCDAVVCIELIEHLYPEVLEEVPYTVFGVIKPRVAVFTTPNVEFNVLFSNSQGFRHEDHKFEWTRAQFKCWANNIVDRYPDYKVSLHGIGWGPPGTESVGTCSQMAVFENQSFHSEGGDAIPNPLQDARNEKEYKYRLMRKEDYPFHVDTRTEKQKFQDQAQYAVGLLSTYDDFHEEDEIHIPLTRILPFVTEWTSSVKDVEDILQEAGWNLLWKSSGTFVIYSSKESSVSSMEFNDEHHEESNIEGQMYEPFNWNAVEEKTEENWDCDSLYQEDCICDIPEIEHCHSCVQNNGQSGEETSPLHKHNGEACKFLQGTRNCEGVNCNCEATSSDRNNSKSSVEVVSNPSSFVIDPSSKSNRKSDIFPSSYHFTDVPVHFRKCSSSNNLYLNFQAEAQISPFESIKKLEGPFDSPPAGSVSLEEAQDRLVDSGYPNSTSAQDMDLDLTPEQVDELFTENDVVTDDPIDHLSDSISVSTQDSDSDDQPLRQPIVVMPQPGVLFEEAMNVENGDVANNNRDGEGNNVEGLLIEGAGNIEDDNAGGIALPHNLEDLIPLIAVVEDFDNDNEIELNVAEPFPPWLLNLLGLANGGVGFLGGVGEVNEENALPQDISDDDDSENDVVDEGLGEENNIDSSSFGDTCLSDGGGPESDADEVAAGSV